MIENSSFEDFLMIASGSDSFMILYINHILYTFKNEKYKKKLFKFEFFFSILMAFKLIWIKKIINL